MYKEVNVIAVFDKTGKSVLMCHRQKNPYKGLYNFVGGKKNENETAVEGAYRELFEETGISRDDLDLTYLFSTRYHLDGIELQVFYGKLDHDVTLIEEKNPLLWIDVTENFADDTRFAGQGNIKHIIDIIHESQQRKGLIEQ